MNYLNQLEELNKTCIIYSGDVIVFESNKKGVAPLIDFYNFHHPKDGRFILVDKIIGRGAVILAKLVGVEYLYTPIISKDALDLANEYQIECEYESVVPYIINRNNTGRCPIESSVLNISDPLEGYMIIQETLHQLQKK